MSVISDIKMILESNSIHLLYDARLCTEQKERWDAIKNADLVEVIRCKYCKHFHDGIYNGEYWMECDEYRIALSSDEWFCADGKRKEDEWNDVSIKG